MSKIWRKAGKYLRNAAGKLIRAVTCCCTATANCCVFDLADTFTATVTINGVTIDPIPLITDGTTAGFSTGPGSQPGCSDLMVQLNCFCLDPNQWIMDLFVYDPATGLTDVARWSAQNPQDGFVFTSTCEPFHFHFEGYNADDGYAPVGPFTRCGVGFLGTGLNYVVIDVVKNP